MNDADVRQGLAALVVGFVRELKNPLFGLSATIDALEQRLGEGGQHPEHVRIVRQQMARILAVTNDLVEYGSPGALAPAAASPGDVLRSAARACGGDAVGRRVSLVVEVEAGLPPVMVDEARLARALSAITKQAVCLSAPGETVLLLASRAAGVVALDLGGAWVAQAAEELPTLFAPFRTLRGCDAGLGLAIARRIIEDHGADIVVAEQPACGRALRVRLRTGT